MRLLTATLILALATWTAGAADDAKDAAKKLEGTYEVVSVTTDGKPDSKKDEVEAFVIKDGEISIVIKGKDRKEVAKYTVDASKNPAHINIVPGNDKTVPGIYKTKETDKGTELTIAFTKGKDATRPKDFKGEGQDAVVLVLLRKKAK